MPRHRNRTSDATLPRVLAHPSLVLLIMIMIVSCSSPGPPARTETVRELSWSRIALPESVAASSLAAVSEALLVGGRASSGGDQPVLFTVDASGSTRPVPLHPTSPYAKVADLISVATRGDEVVALGVAYGGAHANPRWTVWAGSTQGLDEYPQTFETFGRQSAGGLFDIVITSDGPAIAPHAGYTRLLVSDSHNGWQTFTAPAGSVLDATTVGDRLYAIIRTDDAVGLWTADLAATRPR